MRGLSSQSLWALTTLLLPSKGVLSNPDQSQVFWALQFAGQAWDPALLAGTPGWLLNSVKMGSFQQPASEG